MQMINKSTEENAEELKDSPADGSKERKPPRPLNRVAVLVTVVGVMAAGVFFSGVFKNKEQAQVAATPVLTVSVTMPKTEQLQKQIAVNGSITAWDTISLGAQQGGLAITSMRVEEGDLVKKGQLLATLDSSVLRAQLESEKAKLNASVASARKAVQPNRQEDINALAAAVSQSEANVADMQAAVVQAQASLADAKTNIKRYVQLQKEGAVSAQELETRETNLKVGDAVMRSAEQRMASARFALQQAREKLQMARVGGRQEDIQVANANVDEIKGNIQRLQAQIEQTFLRAPVDGLITHRNAHIGDIAAAGSTLFEMARDNRLELKAQVPEADLHNIKPHDSVTMHSAVTGDQQVDGVVREISPAVDATTRLACVRIDVPTSSKLKPGAYAEGRIFVGKYQALTVPARSIITLDERSTVFVVQPDKKVKSVPVTLGTRSGDLVEIVSGVTPDENIVVEGAGFLKDGDLVAVGETSK